MFRLFVSLTHSLSLFFYRFFAFVFVFVCLFVDLSLLSLSLLVLLCFVSVHHDSKQTDALKNLSLEKKEGETTTPAAPAATGAASGPFGSFGAAKPAGGAAPAFTFGAPAGGAAAKPAAGGFSFGSFAATGTGAGFGTGAGAAFAPPPPPPSGDGEEANPEAYEAKTSEYKAALKPEEIPDEVEVKTFEEAEEALYEHRCKLYRFDRDSEQWKERGTGDVKILRHKENGKVRILMRQEKTLKICANHLLTPDIKFTPNQGTDRSWVWTCQDFADLELKDEILAIRFKTAEIANNFLEKAKEGQAIMKTLIESEEKTEDAAAGEEKKEEPEAEKKEEETEKKEE